MDMGIQSQVMSKIVCRFPNVFRAPSMIANLVKYGKWWRERAEIMTSYDTKKLSISHTFLGARKRVELKCAPRRGRKIAAWKTWIYPLIREDFERLKVVGLKFSPKVLLLVAKNAFLSNSHPTFCPNVSPNIDSRPLIEGITPRWVQQFQERHGIVHRTQIGKLMVSPTKTEFIERSIRCLSHGHSGTSVFFRRAQQRPLQKYGRNSLYCKHG